VSDPLRYGAWSDGEIGSFCVFAPDAESVQVCIEQNGHEALFEMQGSLDKPGVHVATLPCAPGDAFCYRVLHLPHARLLDPYARRILRTEQGPRSVVAESRAIARTHQRPGLACDALVIYEAHVRGMTMLHPEVAPEARGTFRGLSHPAVLDHLQRLGITALELMPITYIAHEPRLTQLGLRNYWGYSPMSFFAFEHSYAADPEHPEREFIELVQSCHARGIEVIVDVVFNHTGELDAGGPLFCLRGLARDVYYRSDAAENATGCGNTLNFEAQETRDLVRASLRYLHGELGVDGVRFDLGHVVFGYGALAEEIASDPELKHLKIFAEPWDAQTYALGRLAEEVFEWNDRFRDDVRSFFFRGGKGLSGALASRYAGSSDVIGKHARSRSVNFVTAHDGFTLRDAVSYTERHNEANGEQNRDGHAHEVSVTLPPYARLGRMRALLAMLYLSRGIPMLSHGDEMERTQDGNNNAYCQDSALTWVHWTPSPLLAWCEALANLRARWVNTLAFYDGESTGDVQWQDARGETLRDQAWSETDCLIARHPTYLVIMNGSAAEVTVTVGAGFTEHVLDSSTGSLGQPFCSEALLVAPYSVNVLAT
jgi:glycogen debranching enzyme GlgX